MNVQGRNATPNTSPRMEAASGPLRFMPIRPKGTGEHDAEDAPHHGGSECDHGRSFDGVAEISKEFLHCDGLEMLVRVRRWRLGEIAIDDVTTPPVKIIELETVTRPLRER